MKHKLNFHLTIIIFLFISLLYYNSCKIYQIIEPDKIFLENIVVEAIKYVNIQFKYNNNTYTGMPYLWGGETAIYEINDLLKLGKVPGVDFGVDCSGLINVVYRKVAIDNGYSLQYRDAASYEIINYCRKIDFNELLPGDIIFFSENGKIFHVAIYHHFENNTIYFIDAYSVDNKVKLRSYNLNSKNLLYKNKTWNDIFYSYGRMILYKN